MSGTLASRAALASVGCALVLGVAKMMAVSKTGSVAMLGSLADTALDLLASLIVLLGVRIAAMPADANHRFGHGKAEALAALSQVAMIAVAAGAIAVRAIDSLRGSHATSDAEFGIGVSVLAIIVSLALIAYQRHVVKATGSIAIHADSIHYQSDLLLNGSVIVALALDQYLGIAHVDAVAGIAIAAWLAWGAWGSASTAIDQLMDKEWPDERRAHFIEVARRHPALKGIHDLRTRSSGNRDFVQFHVWVDPAMTVAQAHVVMDEVEAQLAGEFPGVEILIHTDPEGHREDGALPPPAA